MQLRSGLHTNVQTSEASQDDRTCNISSCGSKNCKLCKFEQLDLTNEFKNQITQKVFNVNKKLSCKSTNIVYMITCTKCTFQYIGKTTSRLSTRMSGHRTALRKGVGPKHLQHHFTRTHSVADLKIKPIDQAVDAKQLKSLENSWICEVGCLFPYGLNYRLKSPKYFDAEKVFENASFSIYSYFHRDPTVNRRCKRGKRNICNSRNDNVKHTAEDTLKEILKERISQDSYPMNSIPKLVNRLKKEECVKLASLATGKLPHYMYNKPVYFVLCMTIDQCRYYFERATLSKTNDTVSKKL